MRNLRQIISIIYLVSAVRLGTVWADGGGKGSIRGKTDDERELRPLFQPNNEKRSAPPKTGKPPLSKDEKEQEKAERKALLKEAIAAMKNVKEVGRIKPTKEELDQISSPTAVGQPLLLGFVHSITDSTNSGFDTKCVRSEVSGGLRLHITNLSQEGTVRVFNADRTHDAPIAKYSYVDTKHGDLWTNTFPTEPGDQVCVQASSSLPMIKEAAYATGASSSTQNRRNLDSTCNNADCVEPAGLPGEANCGPSGPLERLHNAVAAMVWPVGNYLYACTGGLIANTGGQLQNLFLTAYHCLSTEDEANALELFFHQYVECSNCTAQRIYDKWTGNPLGASIMATYPSADASLLRLHQDPPSGTVFLGYDASDIAYDHEKQLYRISHPDVRPQAYSEHQVDTNRGLCTSLPKPNFIYSSDNKGGTEGGSSGSPVVKGDGQIVGQLYGACGRTPGDPCNTVDQAVADANGWLSNYDDATVDGSLYMSFNTFAPWLTNTCDDENTPSSCRRDTACCSGMGNCSGGNPRNRRCLPWPHSSCTEDADCDDGLFCNGAETCDLVTGNCQAGTDPCSTSNQVCHASEGCVDCIDDSHCTLGYECSSSNVCVEATAAPCVENNQPCASGDICCNSRSTCMEWRTPGNYVCRRPRI